MSDATHLRLHARTRIVATCIGIWFVASTLLAARHEALTAHWLDRSGRAFHALRAAHSTATDRPVLHARSERPDLDACELVVARHAAASPANAPPRTGVVARAELATYVVPPGPVVAGLVYRLAPKTSPPHAS
jgi:hypothetical protein